MRDIFAMWRSTKMAVLAALCAALYAALLIPFKAIPLIPGVTEMRPANVVPVVGGLLFGPAAAWGCAFGNLIGDFFGTLGPGSFFGFIGNFLYAYIPYRLWRLIMRDRPATGARWQAVPYIAVAVIASMSCGVFIGWGVDLLGIVPYQILTAVISINNSVAAVALGLLVVPLLYPRARNWGLLYDDLMKRDDYRNGPLAVPGAIVLTAAAIVGSLVAVNMFLGGESGPVIGLLPETLPFSTIAAVCAAAIVIGTGLLAPPPAILSPEKQVRAEEITATDDAAAAIEVDDVSFQYRHGQAEALNGVTLSQQRGSVRVLMGRTGAGKSTLCRALNGVVPALVPGDFSGTVRLFGRDITGIPVHRLAPVIGEVFQDFEAQLLTSSVEAEVAFPLENMAVPRNEMQRDVKSALQQIGLWEQRHRDPVMLSGGQKQRIALAATLVTDPDIIVLDEPTTDLDPQARHELLDHCRDLRSAGRTLIIAEHQAELAIDADRLTVLSDGRVAFDGAPQKLLSDAERTRQYGIRPLDVPALFAHLGRPEAPLTVDRACELLEDVRIDRECWQEIATPWLEDAYREKVPQMGTPAIETRNLHHTYDGEIEALRGVNLEVHEGEFVAVLGKNGSGKTTLARHFNGLLRPTSGQFLLRGDDAVDRRPAELARSVGYLFQDPDHQIFAGRVADEVAFGPKHLDLPEDEIDERVADALATVGLDGYDRADPFTLTKGQRQQVALASVLAMQPQIIVFDEPTTGLDGPQQRQMMEQLRQLNESGHTIIMITHCAWAAAEYTHRSIVLEGGELIADVPTREVFANDELLERSGHRRPQITRLGLRLWNMAFLSVAETAYCIPGGGGR